MKNIFYVNELWKKIVDVARQYPEKIVLSDTRKNTCTYAEFIRNVDAYALLLQARGVQRGERVLFLEKPNIRGIEIFFALYRVGAVVVIADPAMGQENFINRATFSNVAHVVIDPALYCLSRIPGVIRLIRKYKPSIPHIPPHQFKLVSLPYKVTQSVITHEDVPIHSDSDALIIFTSGTTSIPKGVVHSFKSLESTLHLIKDEIKAESHHRFFSSQLHFSIIALMSGASAILDTNTEFSARRFLGVVRAYSPTHVFLLPLEGERLYNFCSRLHTQLPICIETIMFGSAPVLVGFLERFKKVVPAHTQVLSIYGSTEILPVCICSAEEKIMYKGQGDYLGRILPGIKIDCSNDELMISGSNLCVRYLHEENNLSFFASGDLGFITPDSQVILSGRKKDMIIKGNHNVYPALFESTISKIPGVKNCALIGIYNHQIQDEQIILCIEHMSHPLRDVMTLKNKIMDELRSGPYSIDFYALPDKIIFTELPVSGRSHKINKQALRVKISKMI